MGCNANPLDGFGAVSTVSGALLGGGSSTQSEHNPLPQSTQQDLANLLSQYRNLGTQQNSIQNRGQQNFDNEQAANQQTQDLFRQHLTQFLAADHGPNPSPEQLAQATQFVDTTFTQPMQNQIDQYNARFSDAQNAQAAALGRAPGSDQATQQAVYTSGLQNLYNLQAQRGAQIQQQALGLNQQNFANQNQALQTGYYGNAALNQNSQFLNSLQQQAFNNQISLMNGRTGVAQIYAGQTGNRSIPGQAGLLPTIGSIGQGVAGAAAGIGSIGSTFGLGGGNGGQINNVSSDPSLNKMFQ